MPENKSVHVNTLRLDLANYRTVPQPDELHAIKAMIMISSDHFWALLDSLIDSGYLPTENIIVLKNSDDDLVVKEGNRRVAALKLINDIYPSVRTLMPRNIANKINALPAGWKQANMSVPCAIFPADESDKVDRIVALAHGKSQKAGRDQWTSMARARHSREANGVRVPELDLFEKFIAQAPIVSADQKERWSSEFQISILEETMRLMSPRFGVENPTELADRYPEISDKEILDKIIFDVGSKVVTYKKLRDKQQDFGISYGLPPKESTSEDGHEDKQPPKSPTRPAGSHQEPKKATVDLADATPSAETPPASKIEALTPDAPTEAAALGSPKAVMELLRTFQPVGKNREKVVALRDEARKLTLSQTPIAFCFLLRSMFEISAKAYCEDHGPKGGPTGKKANGEEQTLAVVLGHFKDHLIKNAPDKQMGKMLHGAMTELGTPDRLLSVTSMHQLVHNPKFSITAHDISTSFGNVFPLLEAMNK